MELTKNHLRISAAFDQERAALKEAIRDWSPEIREEAREKIADLMNGRKKRISRDTAHFLGRMAAQGFFGILLELSEEKAG